MLAEMADNDQQVLAEQEDGTAFEYKFDGARIQIHRKDDKVRIISRRLTDVTDSIPEIVDFAKKQVRASEFIIEGELVAIGATYNPSTFMCLMHRNLRHTHND